MVFSKFPLPTVASATTLTVPGLTIVTLPVLSSILAASEGTAFSTLYLITLEYSPMLIVAD